MAGKKKLVSRVAILDDMTIYHAMRHKETLIEALGKADQVELDLAAVGEIDSAGFQLLVMAKQEAVQRGKQFVIVSHSAAVSELLDFLGMVARFGDPLLVSAADR